jgi:hypothetical protein
MRISVEQRATKPQSKSAAPPLYIERPPQSHPQTWLLPHCAKNRHFRAIAYPYPRAENACRPGSILRGVAVNQLDRTPRQHQRTSHAAESYRPLSYLARIIRGASAPHIARDRPAIAPFDSATWSHNRRPPARALGPRQNSPRAFAPRTSILNAASLYAFVLQNYAKSRACAS